MFPMVFGICLDKLSAFRHLGYEVLIGPSKNKRPYVDDLTIIAKSMTSAALIQNRRVIINTVE